MPKKQTTPDFLKNVANPEYIARAMRMTKEIARGFDFLERFDQDRVVTVFGSAQLGKKDPACLEAQKFGKMLAENGITVVTGGGPGIMEAANHGAWLAGGRSVGINIFLQALKERKNPYVNESIAFNYFFARKLILAHIAQAYVYFPGGYGTLDEFFEICTLTSTEKIDKKLPIVMVGKKYWDSLSTWLEEIPVKKYKTLTKEKLKIWTVVDSAEEAFEIVKDIPKRIKRDKSV